MKQAKVVFSYNPRTHPRGGSRRDILNSRPAWSAKRPPGHPGPFSETLAERKGWEEELKGVEERKENEKKTKDEINEWFGSFHVISK